MKTAGNKDLNKDQFEIPESSADDGGMSVPEAKCNVWDIFYRARPPRYRKNGAEVSCP